MGIKTQTVYECDNCGIKSHDINFTNHNSRGHLELEGKVYLDGFLSENNGSKYMLFCGECGNKIMDFIKNLRSEYVK